MTYIYITSELYKQKRRAHLIEMVRRWLPKPIHPLLEELLEMK